MSYNVGKALIYANVSLFFFFFSSIPEGLNSGEIITDTEGKNLGKFRNYKGIYGLALLRVGQALKANKTGMNIRDYKLKTQIPEWWPRHEI